MRACERFECRKGGMGARVLFVSCYYFTFLFWLHVLRAPSHTPDLFADEWAGGWLRWPRAAWRAGAPSKADTVGPAPVTEIGRRRAAGFERKRGHGCQCKRGATPPRCGHHRRPSAWRRGQPSAFLHSSFPFSFFLFLLEPHRAGDAGAPCRRRVLWGGPKQAVPVCSLSAMTTVEAADETGNRQYPLAGSVGGRPRGSVRLGGCGGGRTSGRPRPVHPPPTGMRGRGTREKGRAQPHQRGTQSRGAAWGAAGIAGGQRRRVGTGATGGPPPPRRARRRLGGGLGPDGARAGGQSPAHTRPRRDAPPEGCRGDPHRGGWRPGGDRRRGPTRGAATGRGRPRGSAPAATPAPSALGADRRAAAAGWPWSSARDACVAGKKE